METYKRRSSKRYSNFDKNAILFFVPYWIISFAAVLFVFVVAALMYIFTPVTSAALPHISRITVISAEMLMSALAGKYSRLPAIVSGFVFGAGFTLVFIVLGLCTLALPLFSFKFLLILLTGILLGMLGAVIGSTQNGKKRRRRY